MKRLFVRVFLALWAASALIGIAIALIEFADHGHGTVAVARALAIDTLALRTITVLVVSACMALVLTRYLTRAFDRLRSVTHRIAEGDLSARVEPELAGFPIELLSLARDFDAMTTRVQKLIHARDQLLSDVAHELGSPLARQRVAIELVRQRAGDEAIPLLDQIEREAERLGFLANEILTLKRLESNGPLEKIAIELDVLVRDVARDAAFEAQTRSVQISEGMLEHVTVEADPELLRRAIDNILRNAIRHTREHTEVEIVLRAKSDEVEILVSDRGPGVPEDKLELIFEPLVRLEPHRGHRQGAGLGLAIAKRALHVHGGSITATNRTEGGLQVSARLPRVFTSLHTNYTN